MTVNVNDFTLKVHVPLISWLYDLIIDGFKNHIKSAIGSAIKSAVQSAVDEKLDGLLNTLTMTEKLPLPPPFNIALVDYTILGLDVEADHVALDIRGTINDTDASVDGFAGSVPPMPPASSAIYDAHHATVDLTTFLFESAAYTYSNRHLLQYTVESKDLPASSPIALNTDTFSTLVPGLKKWPSTPMSISAGVSGTPTITFANGSVGLALGANFNFTVLANGTKVDAFGLVCLVEAFASASVVAETLRFAISPNVTCTPTVGYTTVGTVNANGFAMIINLAIAALIPMANKKLQNGIPLPTIDGIGFANSEIIAHDSLLTLATDITYKTSQ